jgi:hypothetical protein
MQLEIEYTLIIDKDMHFYMLLWELVIGVDGALDYFSALFVHFLGCY